MSVIGPANFTTTARYRWNEISKESQELFLNNVWCGGCLGPVPMNLQSGEMKKDLLALKGACRICGKNIARAVEPEGV